MAERVGFLQKHGGKLLASILIGAGLAWVLARGGLPLVPPRASFARVRPWAIAGYVVTLVVVHWFRAARWRHLLRPVGDVSLRSVIAVSWLGFCAILLSPLRTGEVVRPYLITKRGSVRLLEATGTIGAERVIDGLVLSVVLFVALRVTPARSPLPDHVGDLPVPVAAVPHAAYLVLALFCAAFATMALFYWRRAFARRMTEAVVGVVSQRLAAVLSTIVERIADGLRFLPSARLLVPFLLETLVGYWFMNAAGMWLLAWGAGLDGITFGQSCVVMGVLGIGILVPAGPGFFGAFQLSMYMALAMFFPEGDVIGPGAAFVFLLYVIQIIWHFVSAGLALVIDPDTKLGAAVDAETAS